MASVVKRLFVAIQHSDIISFFSNKANFLFFKSLNRDRIYNGTFTSELASLPILNLHSIIEIRLFFLIKTSISWETHLPCKIRLVFIL